MDLIVEDIASRSLSKDRSVASFLRLVTVASEARSLDPALKPRFPPQVLSADAPDAQIARVDDLVETIRAIVPMTI